MPRKYFGTDGIRGEYGVEPLTYEFFKILGLAIGKSLFKSENHKKKIIFGQDTRESSKKIIVAISIGLLESDCEIHSAGIVPTPAISLYAKKGSCIFKNNKKIFVSEYDLGIMVSASHNLYKDNGIKIFDNQGIKISKDEESHIEDYIEIFKNKTIAWKYDDNFFKDKDKDKVELDKRFKTIDLQQQYIDFCLSTLNKITKKYNLTLDLANGANYEIAEKVFHQAGFKINIINNKPNGKNINDKCGSTYLKNIPDIVKNNNSDYGISMDGDGDRLVIVNSKGQILDGDDIIYTIIKGKIILDEKIKGVVGTIMTNQALENFLKSEDIKFLRSSVGDKNVFDKMIENKFITGGETSGHILMLKYSSTGDSIVAALQFLYYSDILNQKNIKNYLDKYPQKITNLFVEKNVSNNIINIAIKEAHDKYESSKLRLIIRKSGTENCIRIMVEAKDKIFVDNISKEIEIFIARKLKSLL